MSKILQLESSIGDHKQKLMKLEEIDIKEYERIIEESFTKISELQTNLSLTQEKNKYLENIIKITDSNKSSLDSSSSQKKVNNTSIDSTPRRSEQKNEKENLNSKEENSFTKKKRKKLSKLYQNILDKKFLNGAENNGGNKI